MSVIVQGFKTKSFSIAWIVTLKSEHERMQPKENSDQDTNAMGQLVWPYIFSLASSSLGVNSGG